MPLNVELLEKVKKHILEEPNRLAMGDWACFADPGSEFFDYGLHGTVPACGTIGCIAGWTCLLGDVEVEKRTTRTSLGPYTAMELLGLEHEPMELFYISKWKDRELYERFNESKDPRERAEIVATVIDQFILEHKKRELYVL